MATVSGSRSAVDRALRLLTSTSDAMAEHSSAVRRRARTRVEEAEHALTSRRTQESDAWRRAGEAEQAAERARAEASSLEAAVSHDRDGRRHGPSPDRIAEARRRAGRLSEHAADLRREARDATAARERCEAAKHHIDRAADEIESEFSRFWAWQSADIARARSKLTSLSSILDAYLASARLAAGSAGFVSAPPRSAPDGAGRGHALSPHEHGNPRPEAKIAGNLMGTSASHSSSQLVLTPATALAAEDNRTTEPLSPTDAAIVEHWTHGGEAMFRRAPEPETFRERDVRDGRSGERSFHAMFRSITENPPAVRRRRGELTAIHRGALLTALIRAGAGDVPVVIHEAAADGDTAEAAPSAATGDAAAGSPDDHRDSREAGAGFDV